jgi:hypothetical protein
MVAILPAPLPALASVPYCSTFTCVRKVTPF